MFLTMGPPIPVANKWKKCSTSDDDDPSLIPLLSIICRHFEL